MTWVVWIIAAVVLAVGEMLTLSFFLAPFAAGALLAALVSAVGGGLIASWVVFAMTSLLLLLVVRPIARAHRKQPARPFGGQRPDRRLDLAALAFLGDERGLVVHRHLPTAEAGRQLLGQDLAAQLGRAFEQDPINTASTRMSRIGVPGERGERGVQAAPVEVGVEVAQARR